VTRMFISHSTSDRSFIERELLGLLDALGFETWFGETDVQSAEQWERSILTALRSSKWLLLVMSPRAAQSEWVKDEVAFAVSEIPDRIIPILLEDCDPAEIHIRLPRIQFIDFRTDKAEATRRLIRLLVETEYKPFLRELDSSNSHRRLLRQYWQPQVDGGLQIVMGRFLDSPGFEQSGLLGVGDASAMVELRSTLESIGLSSIPIAYSDQLNGEGLKTNLVVLGGPDPNTLTGQLSKRIASTLRFGDPKRREISFRDVEENKIFSPRIGKSGEVESDCGILIVGRNPFAPTKRVAICAGSFGYGTWAAVRFLLSSAYLHHPLGKTEAEFLLETDVLWSAPQEAKLMVSRELSKVA